MRKLRAELSKAKALISEERDNARLAQVSCSQTRRHAHRVRLQVPMPELCSVSHREVGTGPAHRNAPSTAGMSKSVAANNKTPLPAT